MCISNVDCNYRGFVFDHFYNFLGVCSPNSNICICDIGFFESDCTHQIKDYWETSFNAYLIGFIVLYSLLGTYAFFRLYLKLKREKQILQGNNRFLYKVLQSPFNLAHIFTLAISILRLIWLVIDPYALKSFFARGLERFLAETPYTLLFLIYCVVLWVWYTLYCDTVKRGQNKLICGGFKPHLKFISFIVIVCQIITSLLKGVRSSDFENRIISVYVVLFFCYIIVFLEFLIYGILLNKLVKRYDLSIKQIMKNVVPGQGLAILKPAEQKESPIKKNEAGGDESPIIQQSIKRSNKVKRSRTYNTKQADNIKSKVAMLQNKGVSPIHERNQSKSMKDLNTENEFSRNQDNSGRPILRGASYVDYREHSTSIDSRDHVKFLLKMKKENKIRAIIHTGNEFLNLKELPSPFEEDDFDEEDGIKIDDSQQIEWNLEIPEPRIVKILTTEERDENERLVIEIKNSEAYRRVVHNDENHFTEIFRRRLLEDYDHLTKSQKNTARDKIILKRIILLTILAVTLEIFFAIVTVIVFTTNLMNTPGGVMAMMYIYGLLEVSAILAIYCLFSLDFFEDKENLRLVGRIGNNKNRITKLHSFKLPEKLRADNGKLKMEQAINRTISPIYSKEFEKKKTMRKNLEILR